MHGASLFSIEISSVTNVDPLYRLTQVCFRRLDQQVIVIRHQTVGMDTQPITFHGSTKIFQKPLPGPFRFGKYQILHFRDASHDKKHPDILFVRPVPSKQHTLVCLQKKLYVVGYEACGKLQKRNGIANSK
jgi:hypothetical protein